MNKKELMQRVVDLEHENLKLKSMNDIYKRQIKVIGFQFSSLHVEYEQLKEKYKKHNNSDETIEFLKRTTDNQAKMIIDLNSALKELSIKHTNLKHEHNKWINERLTGQGTELSLYHNAYKRRVEMEKRIEELKRKQKLVDEFGNPFKTFFNLFIRR